MTYKDNQPTFNINRKVVNFKDFNKDSEEAELKKISRQNKPNSERQQLIGNPRTKYNKVTHKLDTNLDPEILKDKISAVEESVINEDVYNIIKSSVSYEKFVETLKLALIELKDSLKSDDSVNFDENNIEHKETLERVLTDSLKETNQ